MPVFQRKDFFQVQLGRPGGGDDSRGPVPAGRRLARASFGNPGQVQCVRRVPSILDPAGNLDLAAVFPESLGHAEGPARRRKFKAGIAKRPVRGGRGDVGVAPGHTIFELKVEFGIVRHSNRAEAHAAGQHGNKPDKEAHSHAHRRSFTAFRWAVIRAFRSSLSSSTLFPFASSARPFSSISPIPASSCIVPRSSHHRWKLSA